MKKNKFLIIILTALLCLSLTACGSSKKEELPTAPEASFAAGDIQAKTFEKFSVQYPASWTVTTDADPASAEPNSVFFSASAPSASGMTTNINIAYSGEAQSFSARDIMADHDPSKIINDLQAQLGATITLESQTAYNYKGIEGVEYAFSCTYNSIPLKLIQIIFVSDKKAYVMSAAIINSQEQQDAEAVLHSLSAK